MTVPLILKLVLFQSSDFKGGVYGGAPLHFSLKQIGGNDDFDYKPVPPGFLGGMYIGRRLGPGFLFFDGRFEYDGRWGRSPDDGIYYWNRARINVGYEWGFFPK
jgi:hypothetical protein